MNKVQILGTMTKNVELKYSQSGSAIGSFGIAYNERYRDKNGQQVDKAMFFDVTVFGKQAETVNQYFSKGSRILIDGSLDFQSWKAQDGTNRSKVGIKMNGFSFIDRKSDTPQANNDDPNRHNISGDMNKPAQHQQPNQQAAMPDMIQEEEIPFSPLNIII